MALSKLKSMFKNDEDDDKEVVEDEEFYNVSKEENSNVNNKMMLLEPRAYSESQQIADYLKNRNAVIVNLKRVTPDQAKRIVDFLSGTLYAIGGDLQKLGGGIFLCTPNNVGVEGKITDELATPKVTKNKKDKDEEEEFNW